ncbi:hypothetical protein GBA52_022847 [Prunus armeniaca]|nr:hypothetical protein GBA52_022847 [Prunus armeniaca]
MEQWVPLFDIFLTSPTPESEASTWLNQSFRASSSTSTPITTGSFLSLLMKPLDSIVVDESSSSSSAWPPCTNRVMFIQTLPNMVQSRVLSFLGFERQRFSGRDLAKLARTVLSGSQELDFWVQRAARNLLDVVSESSYEWISCLSLDSGEDEFESLPGWLKDSAASSDLVLPWLPISPEALDLRTVNGNYENIYGSLSQVGEGEDEDMNDVLEEMNIDNPESVHLEPEIKKRAVSLKARVVDFQSTSETVGLAKEIRKLCLEKGGDSFTVLVEVKKSLLGQGQVLCSIILPKLLALEEPASRVLVTATVEYCKLHQRASEYALLFPLILRRDGINNPIHDVITRIIKESLHPAHVASFCQKLLCGEKDERKVICLPCHQYLITDKMVWTESFFNLLQSILNHNVHLSQNSVDQIIYQVQQLAERFSNSLKFGNFLLCFVTKCSPFLKHHKLILTRVVEHNKTFLAKSILGKLAGL